ncbi:Golgi to ER traffic- protein [Puccinia graminis f. sp. tritici]|uniref:Golgi to ER traffic-protein n=1 Tax=Puccinia graminis f. sp. tritici TaxID=56615 RepID=A0A5B0Q7K5_PUCGR|nr:Golgi to ER traffic- protein [Puccinia graminis f. sp. tritici]
MQHIDEELSNPFKYSSTPAHQATPINRAIKNIVPFTPDPSPAPFSTLTQVNQKRPSNNKPSITPLGTEPQTPAPEGQPTSGGSNRRSIEDVRRTSSHRKPLLKLSSFPQLLTLYVPSTPVQARIVKLQMEHFPMRGQSPHLDALHDAYLEGLRLFVQEAAMKVTQAESHQLRYITGTVDIPVPITPAFAMSHPGPPSSLSLTETTATAATTENNSNDTGTQALSSTTDPNPPPEDSADICKMGLAVLLLHLGQCMGKFPPQTSQDLKTGCTIEDTAPRKEAQSQTRATPNPYDKPTPQPLRSDERDTQHQAKEPNTQVAPHTTVVGDHHEPRYAFSPDGSTHEGKAPNPIIVDSLIPLSPSPHSPTAGPANPSLAEDSSTRSPATDHSAGSQTAKATTSHGPESHQLTSKSLPDRSGPNLTMLQTLNLLPPPQTSPNCSSTGELSDSTRSLADSQIPTKDLTTAPNPLGGRERSADRGESPPLRELNHTDNVSAAQDKALPSSSSDSAQSLATSQNPTKDLTTAAPNPLGGREGSADRDESPPLRELNHTDTREESNVSAAQDKAPPSSSSDSAQSLATSQNPTKDLTTAAPNPLGGREGSADRDESPPLSELTHTDTRKEANVSAAQDKAPPSSSSDSAQSLATSRNPPKDLTTAASNPLGGREGSADRDEAPPLNELTHTDTRKEANVSAAQDTAPPWLKGLQAAAQDNEDSSRKSNGSTDDPKRQADAIPIPPGSAGNVTGSGNSNMSPHNDEATHADTPGLGLLDDGDTTSRAMSQSDRSQATTSEGQASARQGPRHGNLGQEGREFDDRMGHEPPASPWLLPTTPVGSPPPFRPTSPQHTLNTSRTQPEDERRDADELGHATLPSPWLPPTTPEGSPPRFRLNSRQHTPSTPRTQQEDQGRSSWQDSPRYDPDDPHPATPITTPRSKSLASPAAHSDREASPTPRRDGETEEVPPGPGLEDENQSPADESRGNDANPHTNLDLDLESWTSSQAPGLGGTTADLRNTTSKEASLKHSKKRPFKGQGGHSQTKRHRKTKRRREESEDEEEEEEEEDVVMADAEDGLHILSHPIDVTRIVRPYSLREPSKYQKLFEKLRVPRPQPGKFIQPMLVNVIDTLRHHRIRRTKGTTYDMVLATHVDTWAEDIRQCLTPQFPKIVNACELSVLVPIHLSNTFSSSLSLGPRLFQLPSPHPFFHEGFVDLKVLCLGIDDKLCGRRAGGWAALHQMMCRSTSTTPHHAGDFRKLVQDGVLRLTQAIADSLVHIKPNDGALPVPKATDTLQEKETLGLGKVSCWLFDRINHLYASSPSDPPQYSKEGLAFLHRRAWEMLLGVALIYDETDTSQRTQMKKDGRIKGPVELRRTAVQGNRTTKGKANLWHETRLKAYSSLTLFLTFGVAGWFHCHTDRRRFNIRDVVGLFTLTNEMALSKVSINSPLHRGPTGDTIQPEFVSPPWARLNDFLLDLLLEANVGEPTLNWYEASIIWDEDLTCQNMAPLIVKDFISEVLVQGPSLSSTGADAPPIHQSPTYQDQWRHRARRMMIQPKDQQLMQLFYLEANRVILPISGSYPPDLDGSGEEDDEDQGSSQNEEDEDEDGLDGEPSAEEQEEGPEDDEGEDDAIGTAGQ